MEKINEDIPQNPTEPKEEEIIDADKQTEEDKEVIVTDAVEAFLGDDLPKEVETPTPTPEVKPDAPSEPTPIPEEPKPVEVPLKEVADEIIAKTKEEVTADVLKALGITAEKKQEDEELGFKFVWEERKEEAPATWKELLDETVRYNKWTNDQQVAKQEEENKIKLAEINQKRTAMNEEWDDQLDYLRKEGLMPSIEPTVLQKIKEGKILTAQERQDAGLKAQALVFEKMWEVATEREKAGKEPILDAVHIFNKYVKSTLEPVKPDGAKAPVSGGSTPLEVTDDKDIPYSELNAARGFEDLLK